MVIQYTYLLPCTGVVRCGARDGVGQVRILITRDNLIQDFDLRQCYQQIWRRMLIYTTYVRTKLGKVDFYFYF